MEKGQLDDLLAGLRRGLFGLYGERLRGLMLFGSWARGDAAPDSDVDVAVILDHFEDHWTEIKRSGELAGDLSLEFDTSLSLIRIREKDWEERRFPLLQNIQEEGIPVSE